MSRIALISDTHCGIRNSSRIFIDYQEKFYTEIFFPYLREHGIRDILHLGDYYDNRKAINFRALNANRQHFLNVLKREGMHMNIIFGNHDIYYRNNSSICSLKELQGWYEREIDIHMEPTVLDYDGYRIGVVPWITDDIEHEWKAIIDGWDENGIDLIAGHFEFAGFEMIRGVINTEDHSSVITAADFSRFRQVISGHYHIRSQRGNIIYLGAQFEFTWNDCGIAKFFHVMDTETGEIEAVRNPHTIFESIRYDDSAEDYSVYDISSLQGKFVRLSVDHIGDEGMFDTFLDRLHAADTHELRISRSEFDFYRESERDDGGSGFISTEQAMDEFIQQQEWPPNVDRAVLQSRMRGLYAEAQIRNDI